MKVIPLDAAASPETVQLWLSQGSKLGLGPGDIVGALTKEADVPGSAIGAIDIRSNHALVEVERDYADQVLLRMSETRLRGRPASLRPARDPAEGPPAAPKSRPTTGHEAPRRRTTRPGSKAAKAPKSRSRRKR
ncbi:MAG: DbpA RNA binding domain-containing protein [Deltaproteobacteria bacterium]|nr:DbpA RNA binding domain-containing protein [Deltaproteobacteria bacterium]